MKRELIPKCEAVGPKGSKVQILSADRSAFSRYLLRTKSPPVHARASSGGHVGGYHVAVFFADGGRVSFRESDLSAIASFLAVKINTRKGRALPPLAVSGIPAFVEAYTGEAIEALGARIYRDGSGCFIVKFPKSGPLDWTAKFDVMGKLITSSIATRRIYGSRVRFSKLPRDVRRGVLDRCRLDLPEVDG